MPGTVDDFMNRFGGEGAIDDQQAQQYHDRFVSTNPDGREFDNQTYHQSATEYLGKLPGGAQCLQPGCTAAAPGVAWKPAQRFRPKALIAAKTYDSVFYDKWSQSIARGKW